MQEQFGDVFAQLLSLRKCSLRALADVSGVPKDTLATWKQARTKNPRNQLDILKVAAALRCNQTELNRLLTAAGYAPLSEHRLDEFIQQLENKNATSARQRDLELLRSLNQLIQPPVQDASGNLKKTHNAILMPLANPAYYYTSGYEAFVNNNFSEAIDNFRLFLLCHGVSPDMKGWANFYLGCSLVEEAEYQEAIVAYNRALKFLPRYSRAIFKRGNAHFALGDYGNAIKDYTTAIQNPQHDMPNKNLDWCYFGRGRTYFYMGEFDKAIEDIAEAVQYMPTYGWAYYFRGMAYWRKVQIEKALNELNLVFECPNQTGDSWGRAKQRIDEIKKAVNNLDLVAQDALVVFD